MDYITDLAGRYRDLFSVLGSIVGMAGFLFGAWRYYREQKTREHLRKSQQQLDEARARLKNLQDYASGLKQYSATV